MDHHSRRNRRGRGRYVNNNYTQPSETHLSHNFSPPRQHQKQWLSKFFNNLYTIFIITGLIAIIYLMLEYHCSVCSAKNELGNITKNIEDISVCT